jgi:hypothetical protein
VEWIKWWNTCLARHSQAGVQNLVLPPKKKKKKKKKALRFITSFLETPQPPAGLEQCREGFLVHPTICLFCEGCSSVYKAGRKVHLVGEMGM